MFTNNKYKNWYDSIIQNAKLKNRNLEYFESHHIVPKSLGGSNDPSNIVNLSAREHFICHLLLTKFTGGQNYQKMIYACQGMGRSRIYQHRYINSRLYESIKKTAALIQSKKFKGKKLSQEHKDNISKGNKGRAVSQETIEKRRLANTGKKRSYEQKERMSIAQKNRDFIELSEDKKREISQKISNKLSNKPKSEEHRLKLSQSLLGKTKGIPKSEETKQKMRKPKSEEHRRAISEGRKGKKFPRTKN